MAVLDMSDFDKDISVLRAKPTETPTVVPSATDVLKATQKPKVTPKPTSYEDHVKTGVFTEMGKPKPHEYGIWEDISRIKDVEKPTEPYWVEKENILEKTLKMSGMDWGKFRPWLEKSQEDFKNQFPEEYQEWVNRGGNDSELPSSLGMYGMLRNKIIKKDPKYQMLLGSGTDPDVIENYLQNKLDSLGYSSFQAVLNEYLHPTQIALILGEGAIQGARALSKLPLGITPKGLGAKVPNPVTNFMDYLKRPKPIAKKIETEIPKKTPGFMENPAEFVKEPTRKKIFIEPKTKITKESLEKRIRKNPSVKVTVGKSKIEARKTLMDKLKKEKDPGEVGKILDQLEKIKKSTNPSRNLDELKNLVE